MIGTLPTYGIMSCQLTSRRQWRRKALWLQGELRYICSICPFSGSQLDRSMTMQLTATINIDNWLVKTLECNKAVKEELRATQNPIDQSGWAIRHFNWHRTDSPSIGAVTQDFAFSPVHLLPVHLRFSAAPSLLQ